MLGLYVSDHPLMGAEAALRRYADARSPSSRSSRRRDAHRRRGRHGALAQVHEARRPHGDVRARGSRRGDRGHGVPEDDGSYGELLDEDAIVCVKARVDSREDTPKLMAMEVTRPELVLDGGPPLRLRVKLGRAYRRRRSSGLRRSSNHPGDSPVFVHLEGPEKDDRAAPRRRVLRRPATASTPSCASSSAPTASRNPRTRRWRAPRSAPPSPRIAVVLRRSSPGCRSGQSSPAGR